MIRIAVVGASGFVGTALVDRLCESTLEIVPLIHTSGNAMALARRGLALRSLDLLNPGEVNAALQGVTHVVNCSRGSNEVMVQGLRNLLRACRKNGVRRFVHLSSVAVYGDPPPVESVIEGAQANPERGSYGWIKLKQDDMIAAAAREGLSSIALCPPNISGPGSYFLVSLVDALRGGTFALLEDGATPCNLVDVTNMVRAIELALDSGPGDGRRVFVTDDDDATWGSVIDALMPLTGGTKRPLSVPREALAQRSTGSGSRSYSVIRSLKHIFSSDVRQAIRKDPLWAKLDVGLRTTVATLGRPLEDKLRLLIEGPVAVPKVDGRSPISPLSRQQLRGVRHSCSLAKKVLFYRPSYTGKESMNAFSRWYRAQHGMNNPMWPMLQQLQS
jgi:nucleoside-diphosphate-sugar epimerase